MIAFFVVIKFQILHSFQKTYQILSKTFEFKLGSLKYYVQSKYCSLHKNEKIIHSSFNKKMLLRKLKNYSKKK